MYNINTVISDFIDAAMNNGIALEDGNANRANKYFRVIEKKIKWLREHDPYYTSSDRDKRKKMSNPYETPEQEKRRRETEIPLSNLNSYQRVQFKQVGGSYTERGEFDL